MTEKNIYLKDRCLLSLLSLAANWLRPFAISAVISAIPNHPTGGGGLTANH